MKLLKIWQILEIGALLLLIPGMFGFSIILTGDDSRNTVFHNYMIFGLPFLVLMLVLKIVSTAAFFRHRRWAVRYNFIESAGLFILSVVVIILFVVSAVTGGRFPLSMLIAPVMISLLLWFITKGYGTALKSREY